MCWSIITTVLVYKNLAISAKGKKELLIHKLIEGWKKMLGGYLHICQFLRYFLLKYATGYCWKWVTKRVNVGPSQYSLSYVKSLLSSVLMYMCSPTKISRKSMITEKQKNYQSVYWFLFLLLLIFYLDIWTQITVHDLWCTLKKTPGKGVFHRCTPTQELLPT